MPEDYSLEEFIDCRARVSLNFRVLGYSWAHPRVRDYLQRVSERIGSPVPDRHYLPIWAYQNLAKQLDKEREEWEQKRRCLEI